MKKLFSFFLLLIVLTSHSQEMPDIVPPSPEAASFGKFSEVPVSLYTGLPNIAVPIASYEVGNRSFPVSIGYHARGIRVEEIASRVGIGWSLNAGGQISRQTRGQPDDGEGGYLNRSNILMDALANETFFSSFTVRNNYHTADAYGVVQPDRFPDQYNLGVGSLSAKFIFNYTNDEPLIQGFDDIVIDYNMGNVTTAPFGTNLIISFVVTDNQGYRYYFGVSKDGTRKARNYDKTIANYAFPEQGSWNQTAPTFELIYNTWMLMDIESPNGDLASFVYLEETSTFYRRSYDKNGSHNDPLNQQNPAYSGLMVNYSAKVESHQYQLKEILHNGGKIAFEATANRQDLNGGKELDKVKIYDTNNDLVKSFELYQSYPATVVDNNQNFDLQAFEPQAAKRMFLDSIAEIGKNSLKKPAYVFTYNEQKLPHRFSNSQDLWGFYNGETNGEYLRFFGPSSEVNRHVVVEKALAGILERIKYPTGGSTRFVYEHNIGKKGPEYDNIVFPAVNAIETKEAVISHFDHAAYSNGRYEKTITISNITGPLRLNVNLPEINGVDHNWACANPIQNDCGFTIKLEGQNGAPNYDYIFAGYQEFYVQSGQYKLILDPDSNLNWDPNPPNTPYFTVGLAWEEELVSSNYLYSAGKRIKTIQFLDSGDNLVSQKSYSYKKSDGSDSGVILSVPSFGSLHPDPIAGSLGFWQPAAAIPGSAFNTFQGNAIGYESVIEYYGDEANNHGKTVHEFTVQTDTDDYMSYPITAPTDNEWLRGLPRFVKQYKLKSDGSYSIVKQVSNEQKYAEQYLLPLIFTPTSKRLDLAVNWPDPGSGLTNEGLYYDKTRTFYRLPLAHLFFDLQANSSVFDPFALNYKIYHLTGGTLGNFKTTEILFDDNETITLVTETETTYNYLKHYQPAMVKSVTSDGLPVVKTYNYPQDLVSSYTVHPTSYSSTPLTALAEQHRVVPVEVREYKDTNNNQLLEASELLNTTETVYAWDGNILEPTLVKVGKGGPNPTMIEKIDFKDYDDKGNLLQVAKADGTDITYIYGYDKSLPVAKVENATYSQVSSQVTNIQIKSDLDDDSCLDSGSCDEKNLRTALNSLRSSLPNAMVTTYTYNPLVGVTSITDPKGYTTYYEYDNLNRLWRVKDSDGNILSENEYHYRED